MSNKIQKPLKTKIIDCTIRDGGHLNNWEFGNSCVKASYFAALKSYTDYFEIGYKNDEKNPKKTGHYGICSEKYISSLFKPSQDCKLLVMIDAGKYTGYDIPECDTKKTPISGIRIAAYPHEVNKAIEVIEMVKTKGYEVFLNLMASSEWTNEQFDILKQWKNKTCLEAVYFADSFGSFIPSNIAHHFEKLRSMGFDRIGFHPHNNLQMAFANTLEAIKQGASHVDASIYGMGRGSGNLPIEILVGYYQKNNSAYNVVPYLDVIDRFYVDLYKQYNWGYSLKSFLGGINNVHPYYVRELFDKQNYTIEEIWNILDEVKRKCPISYSTEKLAVALQDRLHIPVNEGRGKMRDTTSITPENDSFILNNFAPTNRHKDRKFLIVGNGPSITAYLEKIKAFMEKYHPVTIGCNFLNNLIVPEYHILVDKKRFLKYVGTVNPKSTLIIPSYFGKKLVLENYSGKYEFIEVQSSDEIQFEPLDGFIQKYNYINVAACAIVTAYQMGASEIFAVGLDGYGSDSKRQIKYFYNENEVPEDKIVSSIRYEKFSNELTRINTFLQEKGVDFSIITPTSHKKYYRNILD